MVLVLEAVGVRIGHFSDCYTPRINGVTTSIQVLKRALEEAGHEVHLFAPDYPEVVAEERVHRLPSVRAPMQPEDRMALPTPWGAWLTQKLDVVHVHTPFAMGNLAFLAARLRRVPMVFTHHTLWEEYAHYVTVMPLWMARWVGRHICDFYFRQSTAVVMPSEEVARPLRHTRVKVPCRVIATGIRCQDLRGGEPERVWQELGLEPGTPIFLYLGRLGKEKSVDFLLKAFDEYRQQGGDGHFVLVGGGLELENLRRQAGPRVHFLGYRERDLVKHYLAAARLFLFASETETQGLVLLEAAAAGLPVLAVSASGVNEAVEPDGTGWLLESGDLAGFVAAMKEMTENRDLHQRLKARSPQWAEGFSDREMARKMVDLYRFLGC